MSSKEWNYYRLSEIASFSQGIQVAVDLQNTLPFEGCVRFLRIVDFTQNNSSDIRYINNPGDKYLVDIDDLVMIRYGSQTAGKIAKGFKGAIANNAFKISPDTGLIDKLYLFYYLFQDSIYQYFQASQTSTTMPAITFEMIGKLEIGFPNLTKQKTIASIIKSLDDKIENNLATNQTLQEIARAIFLEWFINFNYPNADGNLKHTEFGEIPESWSIYGIGEICYVQNGYAFKSKDFQEQGEVGIIKIKNINGNVVDIQNTDFVDASVVSSLDTKFKIESGSLLIAMTGAEVGKIGLVPLTEKNLWLNQRVGMFQEKIAYGNLFMYLLLSTDTYQTAIQNSALGSAQPNISTSAIESIRAIIPPAELIETFGKTVKPMFEKILDNLAENETLKTTRDSLLPKLMSGEIEVNG